MKWCGCLQHYTTHSLTSSHKNASPRHGFKLHHIQEIIIVVIISLSLLIIIYIFITIIIITIIIIIIMINASRASGVEVNALGSQPCLAGFEYPVRVDGSQGVVVF